MSIFLAPRCIPPPIQHPCKGSHYYSFHWLKLILPLLKLHINRIIQYAMFLVPNFLFYGLPL